MSNYPFVSPFKLLIFLAISVSLTLLTGPPVVAQSEDEDPARLLDESECVSDITTGLAAEEEKPFFEFLDAPQESVSTGIESLAQSIDEFFAAEKVLYETSGSYVQLTGDLLFEEPGEVHSKGRIRVRLRVPHTQKKLKLVLENDPDEQRSTVERVTDQAPQTGNEDRDLFAGVEKDMGKPEKWQLKPSVGLKLRLPIEYYVRLRANRTYQYERWRLYLSETPYWFDTTGFGFDSVMEWSYPLRNDLLFRSVTTLRYTDERDMFDASQILVLAQTFSPTRAITYEAAVFADSEPAVYATQYLLLARYRQRVHSDYMFLEIVPQVNYLKENDFNDEPSLLLRLEFLFQK